MRSSPSGSFLKTAVISLLACIGTFFLLSVMFSWASLKLDLSSAGLNALSGAALCGSCFAGTFAAANIRRKNGIVTGIVFGGAVFIVLMIVGAAVIGSFTAGGVITKAIMILCCSAAGGIIGVNTKSLLK